ncbi:MAG: class I SAM-dependent methyltransferase [Pseudomonadota bacterium]
MLRKKNEGATENGNPGERVLRRYRNMGAYHRLFSRFKLRLDPMFSELPSLLSNSDIRMVADIGCGYGVPACWILERFPHTLVYGIDPDPGRVCVASRAVGKRGFITIAGAPDIPRTPGPVDMATMLDIIHFLDDDQFRLTLKNLSVKLGQKGRLMIRATLPPAYSFPWVWWMENVKNKAAGIQCYYRIFDEIKTIVLQAGFDIELTAPSGSKGDLIWFILKVRK